MKKIIIFVSVEFSILIFAMPLWADVPPPPVNQQIGIPDSVFNSLQETDCRLCHENPDQFPVEDETIPDRHHLLVDTPVTVGTCSVSEVQCLPNAGVECSHLHDVCQGASVAPFPPLPGGTFTCFSCHDVDCSTGVCDINVYRDCLFCHEQISGNASVHHLTPTARGGDCVSCHGGIVNNMDDGHTIPTYAPSLVTPRPSYGLGPPNPNFTAVNRGACDYCHTTGNASPSGIPNPRDPGIDTGTGTLVFGNAVTHHDVGFGINLEPDYPNVCEWCHDIYAPVEEAIRVCEGCHGFESLHNIQADSNNDNVIEPGGELPWYGHIGNNDDCIGCHEGYVAGSAPGAGPVTPTINYADMSVVDAGSDTAVTLSGSAFTNIDAGVEWTSSAVLTDADGDSVELIPDSISQDSMTVTIPGTLATGNYELRALKGEAESNHVVISVKPDVIITNVDCYKKKGLLTVAGSGFGKKVEGTDEYINVEVNGETVDVISWTDNQIRASVFRCSNRAKVTVNALFGSAVKGEGKPPKPCKGRGCNK